MSIVTSSTVAVAQADAPPLSSATPPDPNVFVAVGLLSAAASTAKSANSSIGVWRRSQLRAAFTPYAGRAVALRFLLAPLTLIPASDPTAVDVAPALLREASAHRDMLFLNMTEGLYRYTGWRRATPLERHSSPPCLLGLPLAVVIGPSPEQSLCRRIAQGEAEARTLASAEAADSEAFQHQAARSSTSSGCGSGLRSSPALASSS